MRFGRVSQNFRPGDVRVIGGVMPGPCLGGLMQIAWVTPDIEKSLKQFDETYRIPEFYRMTVDFPAEVLGRSGKMQLHVALANVDNVQFELIEPLGGLDGLFRDALPADGRHANVLHHVCVKVEGTLADWDNHVAALPAESPVVFVGDVGSDVRVLYTDDRDRLGVYVEHIWRSPAAEAAMASVVPSYIGGRPVAF